jgi:hypothetical protein
MSNKVLYDLVEHIIDFFVVRNFGLITIMNESLLLPKKERRI